MTSDKNRLLRKIKKRLDAIYPNKDCNSIFLQLKKIIDKFYNNNIIQAKRRIYRNKPSLNRKDSILITYGDSITLKGDRPLKTLSKFLKKYVKKSITTVHILPFCPYSSDDGFSVIDYKKVNPDFGTWQDIRELGKDYRIMADIVMNHISRRSIWFQGFLKGDPKYMDYFISFDKKQDTSSVFRPRTHPLLSRFRTRKGVKYVWTTFSRDQVDLNYENPALLIEMMNIILFYLSNSIEIIRLDAIGFIWKKLGTSCFHMKNAHEIVKLLRNVLEYIAPYAVIITETNVPHKDNISYFGKNDEAHMVYQFPLPPLVLDAITRQDTRYLQRFYKKIQKMPVQNLFFNFLASHDGIGILGAKGYLNKKQFNDMLTTVKNHKGVISYKSITSRTKSPYEMNISYFDAINNPNNKESIETEVKRFITSQAIIVGSKGIPGIYIHSLLGSRNDIKGMKRSGINRRINREKLDLNQLEKELNNTESIRHNVLKEYKNMLNAKSKRKEFDPYSKQSVITSDKKLFILERTYKSSKVHVVINFSRDEIQIPTKAFRNCIDIITGKRFNNIILPYRAYFLSDY